MRSNLVAQIFRFALITSLGCDQSSLKDFKQPISVAEAKQIAVKEVMARERWMSPEVDPDVAVSDQAISMFVYESKEMEGVSVLISLDRNGKILNYDSARSE